MRWLLVAALLLSLVPMTAAKSCPPKNPHCSPRPSPTATPMTTAGLPTSNPSAEPTWTLIFADDFSTDVPLGSFPTDRYTAYPYPWTTLGGYYYPEKVNSVSGAMLRYHLHAESGQWLMSAVQPKIGYQTYGRYELRWRADSLSGYYAVPLLWPQSESYLRDGEIDWPEGNLTGNVAGFIHHTGATSGGDQKACSTATAFASGWHTTVTEWTPGRVRLYLDGALVCEETQRVPSTPMRWQLQVTTSPQGLPPAGTSGYFDVDHLKVWSYTQ